MMLLPRHIIDDKKQYAAVTKKVHVHVFLKWGPGASCRYTSSFLHHLLCTNERIVSQSFQFLTGTFAKHVGLKHT